VSGAASPTPDRAMNIQANLYKTGGRYYFQPRISSTAGLANSTANLFNPKIRHSGECRNPDFTI
jgi:hypothetical protein